MSRIKDGLKYMRSRYIEKYMLYGLTFSSFLLPGLVGQSITNPDVSFFACPFADSATIELGASRKRKSSKSPFITFRPKYVAGGLDRKTTAIFAPVFFAVVLICRAYTLEAIE